MEGASCDIQALQSVSVDHNDCLVQFEHTQEDLALQLFHLKFKMEEGEDKSRRNNIKQRGVPETIAGQDLCITVVAILNMLLGLDPTTPIELDRVHRIQEFRADRPDRPNRPRDILCQVNFLRKKEEIMRRARDMYSDFYEDISEPEV